MLTIVGPIFTQARQTIWGRVWEFVHTYFWQTHTEWSYNERRRHHAPERRCSL